MKYLIGSKENFHEFIDSIRLGDRVGVFSHNDLDGIASAVFMTLILKKKGVGLKVIDFGSYSVDVFDRIRSEVEEGYLNKILFIDMSLESANAEEFEKFKKEHDCFLIDHHPMIDGVDYGENVIKTESGDCVAQTIFDLGEELLDKEQWEWLRDAAMLADYSWKKKENADFLKGKYEGLSEEDPFDSVPGEIATKISYALVYFKGEEKGLNKVYDLLLQGLGGLREIEKYSGEVKAEIDRYIEDFKRNAEYYEDRKVFFYEMDPKFDIGSIFSNIVSGFDRDKTVIIFSPIKGKEEFLKGSARNQDKKENVNKLVRRAMEDLQETSGGGHAAAAGFMILKKDLEKFKENVLKEESETIK
tara:strand:- start:332 stop:1408 length:1077 start_codon:yes stop_codon:yes gene_type:complete